MRIFVFGSNLQGRHGKGAALYARKHKGAIYGQAYGLQGNSFAVPTKRTPYEFMTLDEVRTWVNRFLEFAEDNPNLEFDLVPIGCNLAGFTKDQIKPLFDNKPNNVYFTKEWDE